MSNTSASGGYLTPVTPSPFPSSLTMVQFLQTVLVGISGLDGTLVRPKWQANPPKQPDIGVNWMAFNIIATKPDTYGYNYLDANNINQSKRHEGLELQCSFYGPDCNSLAGIVADGFQITQNLEALQIAKMGFTNTGDILHVPDFVNERWIDRVEMTLFLRREIQRSYPILSVVSATGTIHTVLGNEEYLINWESPEGA